VARLGIVGTLVWDTIHGPDDRTDPITDWGGIAYSLAAFEAAAPSGWCAVPIIKVGSDLRDRAGDFLDTLERLATRDHVVSVPQPNNRVDLFYHDRSRRCERLQGGVPGWTRGELARAALVCDALYVNFISGWEVDVTTAAHLKRDFDGPTYCDVHSLLLAVGPDGVREPRPLADREAWLSAFHLLQVNEDELRILSARGSDTDSRAEDLLAAGPDVVFATLGKAGAAWVARPGSRWMGADEARADGEPLHGEASVEAPADQTDSDPTGCGDVWGVGCFTALLGGASVPEAVRLANRLASRTAGWRGATGLANRLADTARDEAGGDRVR
jgi:hypothetical protein